MTTKKLKCNICHSQMVLSQPNKNSDFVKIVCSRNKCTWEIRNDWSNEKTIKYFKDYGNPVYDE